MNYDGKLKCEVVFVDEYANWWLLGFYNGPREAEGAANEYLRQYQLEDPEPGQEGPIWLGDNSPFGDLSPYPSTIGMCFDKEFATPEGCVMVRGFIF